MPLDPDRLLRLMPIETRHAYTSRDTILYALGVGVGNGAQPAGAALAHLYEDGLKALPTMAVVLAYPGFWMREAKYGLDWPRILHGEQSIRLHQPLPVEAHVRGLTTIEALYDKGAEKGALLYARREIHDESTGDHLATVMQGALLRGDGGFGGASEGAPRPRPIPSRQADGALDLPTRTDQAAIYRLSGDTNPLHIDPAVAAQAGFPRPILHGLCTYGVAGRAVLELLCAGEPDRLKRLDARFTSPVFPGDTIRTEVWRDGAGQAAFRASAVERAVVVLGNGYVEHG